MSFDVKKVNFAFSVNFHALLAVASKVFTVHLHLIIIAVKRSEKILNSQTKVKKQRLKKPERKKM